MTTLAFDPITLSQALVMFAGKDGVWQSTNEAQQFLLGWAKSHLPVLTSLPQLPALASASPEELNQLLAAYGALPAFTEPLNGLGITAIIRRTITPAGTLYRVPLRPLTQPEIFTGVHLTGDQVQMTMVEGMAYPLVQIKCLDGATVWLTHAAQPANELELMERAEAVLHFDKRPSPEWTDVVVPMFNIALGLPLSWLTGLAFLGASGITDYVTQAYQALQVQMAPETQIGGPALGSNTLQLSYPFMGFLTHPNMGDGKVALSPFYANTDSWIVDPPTTGPIG